jgi:hypothetical protein
MRREQKKYILADLKKKMVFIVGPRQVGKTWLAKEIMKEYKNPLYLNYDNVHDKVRIKNMVWSEANDLVVLDEIHKMPKWKNFVKGVFDVRTPNMHLLITGSARLDTFRKAGDSMAGRFFVHHLLPLSLKELQGTLHSGDLERLLVYGGFPEPFLAAEERDVIRWRQEYLDRLLREDILDFSKIEKLGQLRNVFELLRTKVSSDISYENIAHDLDVSPKTVKKYIEILEALYIVFVVRPFSKKIQRSIKKSPKVYFYDSGLVVGDAGKVFENHMALALLKHAYGERDVLGKQIRVMYLRDKERREVDFLLVEDDTTVKNLIEAKLTDTHTAPNLIYYSERLAVPAQQVVRNAQQSFVGGKNVTIVDAHSFLNGLFL